ncbi:hypothetical protein BSKO_06220 [Bryopsis sp. KO-2023]|nr:hypothetical protein BSKO_06220 [Bryopsis sp. KO-2023]
MLKPILTEIREQFRLLAEVRNDPSYQLFVSGRVQGPAGSKKVLWSPEQWWEAFVFVFLCSGFQGGDDLLFFVYAPTHRARALRSYFVKRKEENLPIELQKGGAKFNHVEWCETVALNLVLQTRYRLDVAACGESMKDVVDDLNVDLGEDGVRVSHEVFGSTTKAHLNPEASSMTSHSAPEDCFPNVCFAVDDFHEAFTSLVLSQPDQCYTVMLNAFGGPLSLSEFAPSKATPIFSPGEAPASSLSAEYIKIPDPQALLPVERSPRRQADSNNAGEGASKTGGVTSSNPNEGKKLQENSEERVSKSDRAPSSPVESPDSKKTFETDGSWSLAGEGAASASGNNNAGQLENRGAENGVISGEGNKANSGDEWMDVENGAGSSDANRDNGSLASSSRNEQVMVRVFAGVVKCDALRIFMAGKDPVQKSKTVRMKRGDEGVAEVVVTFDCDDFPFEKSNFNPIKMVREGVRGLGPKDALRKGLGLAARAAKDALNKQAQTRVNNVDGIMALGEAPLKCSLMTLSLPMQKLATEILDAVVP